MNKEIFITLFIATVITMVGLGIIDPILATGMGAFSSVSRASAVAIRTERGRIYGMGSATGAFTTSLSVGQVLGPILFGVIADLSSIPVAFLAGGLVGLTGTIASGIFFKKALGSDPHI